MGGSLSPHSYLWFVFELLQCALSMCVKSMHIHPIPTYYAQRLRRYPPPPPHERGVCLIAPSYFPCEIFLMLLSSIIITLQAQPCDEALSPQNRRNNHTGQH